jgi:hypothetical protein
VYFFGREYDAYTLDGQVLRARLTVLFGASGSGKSSLIHAARLAHLRAARPGCAIVTWNRWQSGFESELLPAMAAAAAPSAARFLVFDQFAEWFEYARDPVRTGFAEALARLVNTADDDTHVLIALREDSLALLDRPRVRIPDILASTVELKPLDLDAARYAIVKPIEAFNRLRGRAAADGHRRHRRVGGPVQDAGCSRAGGWPGADSQRTRPVHGLRADRRGVREAVRRYGRSSAAPGEPRTAHEHPHLSRRARKGGSVRSRREDAVSCDRAGRHGQRCRHLGREGQQCDGHDSRCRRFERRDPRHRHGADAAAR